MFCHYYIIYCSYNYKVLWSNSYNRCTSYTTFPISSYFHDPSRIPCFFGVYIVFFEVVESKYLTDLYFTRVMDSCGGAFILSASQSLFNLKKLIGLKPNQIVFEEYTFYGGLMYFIYAIIISILERIIFRQIIFFYFSSILLISQLSVLK